MRILYVHGFGSKFDPDLPKVKELMKLGSVDGVDVDYLDAGSVVPRNDVVRSVIEVVIAKDIDLIVGTSMGGWAAAVAGCETGIPFVAANPVLSPSKVLPKLNVSSSRAASYEDFPLEGCRGLILLDEGDDLLDSKETFERLKPRYIVNMFAGGSHRFDHMEDSLDLIELFVNSSFGYGVEPE